MREKKQEEPQHVCFEEEAFPFHSLGKLRSVKFVISLSCSYFATLISCSLPQPQAFPGFVCHSGYIGTAPGTDSSLPTEHLCCRAPRTCLSQRGSTGTTLRAAINNTFLAKKTLFQSSPVKCNQKTEELAQPQRVSTKGKRKNTYFFLAVLLVILKVTSKGYSPSHELVCHSQLLPEVYGHIFPRHSAGC